MSKIKQRDFYSSIGEISKLKFYTSPFKELIKINIFFLKIAYFKMTTFIFKDSNKNRIKKQNKQAREKFPNNYVGNNSFFEIAIGNQTRTV